MKFSAEVMGEISDFIMSGKSGLDLIAASETDDTITIESVINRLQVLCDVKYIGQMKTPKGWEASNKGLASLSKNDPYEVRKSVALYNENGYSAYALIELENQLGNIRIPLISSYSSSLRLFPSGKTNEKCAGLMKKLASSFKINLIEDGYNGKAYEVSKPLIGNATVCFNTNIKGDFENITLSDAEKLVVVLDVITKQFTKKSFKELKVKTHHEQAILHASNLVTMLNFCSIFNLGDDKSAIYHGLSLQLANSLNLLDNDDLKVVSAISNKATQNLCDKFSIKVGKYDYVSHFNTMKKILEEQDAEIKRKKAEEEAKKKAEEEARKKAEEEAKKKAEEEAKKKAEEEARKKAEEEARKKAEEEARKKAEEEARKKAEEEARKKAEEEEIRKKGAVKSQKVVKLTTVTKALDKMIVGVIMKEMDKSSTAYNRVTTPKTKQKYYDRYDYFERLLGMFYSEKEKEEHSIKNIHYNNDDYSYKISVDACRLVNLRNGILSGVSSDMEELKGIAGPVAVLNKFATVVVGENMKKVILEKLNYFKDNDLVIKTENKEDELSK